MLLDGKLDDGEDDPGSSNVPDRGWAVGVGILAAATYCVFAALGQPGRGTASACMSASIIIAVRLHVRQWKGAWFWIWTAFISLVHAVLLFTVPWPNTQFRAAALTPVGILDFVIVYFFLKLIGKHTKQSSIDADS